MPATFDMLANCFGVGHGCDVAMLVKWKTFRQPLELLQAHPQEIFRAGQAKLDPVSTFPGVVIFADERPRRLPVYPTTVIFG